MSQPAAQILNAALLLHLLLSYSCRGGDEVMITLSTFTILIRLNVQKEYV